MVMEGSLSRVGRRHVTESPAWSHRASSPAPTPKRPWHRVVPGVMRRCAWLLSKVMQARESCYLGYAPEKMYNVVADVGNYKAFLPWCTNSTVHSSTADPKDASVTKMEATLEVGFPPLFSEQYTSAVTLRKDSHITAELHETSKGQTLSALLCTWHFEPTEGTKDSSKVDFELEFAFSNTAHEAITRTVFRQVVEAMQTSFIKRCEALNGPPSHDRLVIPSAPTSNPTGSSSKPSPWSSIFG
eukprot:GGOE01000822.1.p1 GENE.GGOE01000822.1~~GGOE01000822.1.p1  ORF type:complete len:243 (+),score=40.92 GGOE01000822.1:24-752(+)